MYLVVNEKELKDLIEKRVLVPYSEDFYCVYIGDNKLELSVKIDADCQDNRKPEVSSKSLLKEYNHFLREVYPASDAILHYKKTRSLRSDRRGKGYERYKELVLKHKLIPEDIDLAVKYEVFLKTNKSKLTGQNEMKFMRLSDGWLSDMEGIINLYEMAKEDREFLRSQSVEVQNPKDDTNSMIYEDI